MVLGNIDNFKGKGLVAFIDILGFAKEIEEKWDNAEDNPLAKLLTLKQKLPNFTKASFDESDHISKTRLYPCRVQTISDSIIISFGFDEPLIHGDVILATMAFLYTISDIWKWAIDLGFTVRGAADIGQIFWNEKEIIGPSFSHVYKYETNYAKTSRILIAPELNKTLANYFKSASTQMDDSVLKMLRQDIDGYIILNPHNLYSDFGKKDLISKLQNLQDRARNFHEKEKYTPLLAILNSDNMPLKRTQLGKY